MDDTRGMQPMKNMLNGHLPNGRTPPPNDIDYGYGDPNEEHPEWQDHDDYKAIPAEGVLDRQGNWWTSSETALAEQDAHLAHEDPEYASALLSFTEAREALRHARVARDFFPVVVPSSAFTRTVRSGKGKGKGRMNVEGKGTSRCKSKIPEFRQRVRQIPRKEQQVQGRETLETSWGP